jgi:hypothetical protein
MVIVYLDRFNASFGDGDAIFVAKHEEGSGDLRFQEIGNFFPITHVACVDTHIRELGKRKLHVCEIWHFSFGGGAKESESFTELFICKE